MDDLNWKTEIETRTPLPLPPLLKNPSTSRSEIAKSGRRRVAFDVPDNTDDMTLGRHHSGLSDDFIGGFDESSHHSRYYTLCAWACIGIFTLVLLIVVAGIVYVSFLNSGLPRITIPKLYVSNLQLINEKMNSNVELRLDVSNKNDNMKLSYGSWKIDVISEGVKLGHARLDGFYQKPQNKTSLDIKMYKKQAEVDKDALTEVKLDMDASDMEFRVLIDGTVGFNIGSLYINKVPFQVLCDQVKQKDVDFGRASKCNVRLFSYRSKK